MSVRNKLVFLNLAPLPVNATHRYYKIGYSLTFTWICPVMQGYIHSLKRAGRKTRNSHARRLRNSHFDPVAATRYPHSKNTRVNRDPERFHWGQTQFRVSDDPEISQLEYDPELGQSYLSICHVYRKLTKVWNHGWWWVTFDPEWGPDPDGPFSGSR